MTLVSEDCYFLDTSKFNQGLYAIFQFFCKVTRSPNSQLGNLSIYEYQTRVRDLDL